MIYDTFLYCCHHDFIKLMFCLTYCVSCRNAVTLKTKQQLCETWRHCCRPFLLRGFYKLKSMHWWGMHFFAFSSYIRTGIFICGEQQNKSLFLYGYMKKEKKKTILWWTWRSSSCKFQPLQRLVELTGGDENNMSQNKAICRKIFTFSSKYFLRNASKSQM